jgi:hypothetical protein
MNRIIILCIVAMVITKAGNAQYIHYDPIPNAPAPVQSPAPSSGIQSFRHSPANVQQATPEAKPRINPIFEFLIASAKINGNDVSQHYVNAKAFMGLYTVNDDPIYQLAVIVPGDGSNSYGAVKLDFSQEIPQTSSTYGQTKIIYFWNFINSTDKSTGTARVIITKEYRPDGTYCTCHI